MSCEPQKTNQAVPQNDRRADQSDRLNNGIEYDEARNLYLLVWTEKKVNEAREAAAELYKKMNWADPSPPTNPTGDSDD